MKTFVHDLPWMQWYPGEFARWTLGWPRETRYIFRDLLTACFYLDRLPTSPKRLADICGMSPKEFHVHWRQPMRAHFVPYKGGLQNLVILERREESLKIHAKKQLGADMTHQKLGRGKYRNEGGPELVREPLARVMESLQGRKQ